MLNSFMHHIFMANKNKVSLPNDCKTVLFIDLQNETTAIIEKKLRPILTGLLTKLAEAKSIWLPKTKEQNRDTTI